LRTWVRLRVLERCDSQGVDRIQLTKRTTKGRDATGKIPQGVVAKISTIRGSRKVQTFEKKCTFSLDMALNQPIMWPEVGESG